MGLVWREQLSVGNDVIDADHKHLVEIINLVEKNMVTINQSELTVALAALSQFSKAHFAREEKIAAAAGYAHVPQLHKSHKELLKQIDQLKHKIEDKWTAASVKSFSDLLRSWLIDHVIKEDLLMKPILKKHSPKLNPK
ncbi:MAG: bacteriohemerythrin [Nitrosomonadales bacterium]|nr:bacteriohemerythrin [Nitrosomonadales bacterium]